MPAGTRTRTTASTRWSGSPHRTGRAASCSPLAAGAWWCSLYMFFKSIVTDVSSGSSRLDAAKTAMAPPTVNLSRLVATPTTDTRAVLAMVLLITMMGGGIGRSADGIAAFVQHFDEPEWLAAQFLIWASPVGYEDGAPRPRQSRRLLVVCHGRAASNNCGGHSSFVDGRHPCAPHHDLRHTHTTSRRMLFIFFFFFFSPASQNVCATTTTATVAKDYASTITTATPPLLPGTRSSTPVARTARASPTPGSARPCPTRPVMACAGCAHACPVADVPLTVVSNR